MPNCCAVKGSSLFLPWSWLCVLYACVVPISETSYSSTCTQQLFTACFVYSFTFKLKALLDTIYETVNWQQVQITAVYNLFCLSLALKLKALFWDYY